MAAANLSHFLVRDAGLLNAASAAAPGLSRDTLALSGGLVIDPTTKAIAPNISMSVNNVLQPGDGAFSAGDLLMVAVLRMTKGTPMAGRHANLAAYVARGEARPAFQRALAAQLAGFTGTPPKGYEFLDQPPAKAS